MNKNCQKYKKKKTVPLFLYFEGQVHLYLSVYLYFYATVCFVELILNIDLCTLFIKYTIILNFNFSHTIYPKRFINHFSLSLMNRLNKTESAILIF